MANLTKKIGFEELGGALFDMAQREAEEALTRSIVGVNKAKGNLKKTAIHLGKAVVAKVASSYIESELIDTAVDVYAGIKVVQGGITGYKAIKEFSEGYVNATNEDAEAAREILGLK